MNKALHHPNTLKVRLRNQNKKRTPNATKVPDRPQLGSTTDQLETGQHKGQDLHRAPPELGCVICMVQRHLQAGFGSICEPRGLNNLAPSQSILFKLIGRVKGMRWSYSKRLAYMVANICKREREEKAKHDRETMIKKWSYNNLRQALLEHRVDLGESTGKRGWRLETELMDFN